jgi:transcriptional regulator with XRE-family HTH domain
MRIDRVKLATEVKRRDITYSQLAQKAGISRSTVSYISGGKRVHPATAQKIADALNMPLSALKERSI